VAITYTKGADAATTVVTAIEQAGGKAMTIQADAADAAAVKGAVDKTASTFGRLDILVNNAGTGFPKPLKRPRSKSWTASLPSTSAAPSWRRRRR
jgi:3-oxoacyl-[acyl-carrier protein] reductase